VWFILYLSYTTRLHQYIWFQIINAII
jgi:hypothetical protein